MSEEHDWAEALLLRLVRETLPSMGALCISRGYQGPEGYNGEIRAWRHWICRWGSQWFRLGTTKPVPVRQVEGSSLYGCEVWEDTGESAACTIAELVTWCLEAQKRQEQAMVAEKTASEQREAERVSEMTADAESAVEEVKAGLEPPEQGTDDATHFCLDLGVKNPETGRWAGLGMSSLFFTREEVRRIQQALYPEMTDMSAVAFLQGAVDKILKDYPALREQQEPTAEEEREARANSDGLHDQGPEEPAKPGPTPDLTEKDMEGDRSHDSD